MLTATMAILDNDDGFAVGGEIKNGKCGPVALYSLWFPRAEVSGVKRAILAALPHVMEVADYPPEILFVGKTAYFSYQNSRKEIIRKCVLYSPGTLVYLKKSGSIRGGAFLLAKDAQERKASITERLV